MHEAPKVNPWLIALTVSMVTFMEILDGTIVNVALRHIAGDLSAGVDESTWVLTSYLVSNAIVLPLAGWFYMLMGRKNFYLMGAAIFTVSSLLCGFAPSLTVLIIMRIIQGLGGGGLQPSSQAILQDSFPPEKRNMAMAFYGMTVVCAPALGPSLGGIITDNWSWRWIFFINVPVGVLASYMTWKLVEDPPTMVRKKLSEMKIDGWGLGLLAVGIGFLQVVLDKGQNEGWFQSSFIFWMSFVSVVAIILFFVVEWFHVNPVVDISLLRNRSFFMANLAMFALGFVLYGSSVLLPMYTQQLMGYTATLAGYLLSPGALIVIVIIPIVGKVMGVVQPKYLAMVGMMVNAAAMYKMSQLNLGADMGTLVKLRLLQGVGLAMLFVPINAMAFGQVDRDKVNSATGLVNLSRNLGASFGISLVTAMLSNRSQVHQTQLVSHLTPSDPQYISWLEQAKQLLVLKGYTPADAVEKARGLIGNLLGQQASLLSFSETFFALGVISLLTIPILLSTKKIKGAVSTSAH
ncbi:DHA2 family efflux MFS transporter permease subunit [Bryobacter aggregatus]|uniref:DHA2 family efflux MFS transporter permease subunit n=1 Tax=Bryobacter aggregatus TaxID=360054 RepID=UPI0004E17792|nr:DHA2 family efflux MFS transporter permease subunit [Bryobacter aggregatus]